MELRDIMLIVHIAAAGAWLGANVIQGLVPGLAARQGVEASAGWFRIAGQLSKRLYMPASILLIVTGSVMVVQDDSYAFEDLFVVVGFGMIVVGALLGIFVFDPGSKAAAEAVESGDGRESRPPRVVLPPSGRSTPFSCCSPSLQWFCAGIDSHTMTV